MDRYCRQEKMIPHSKLKGKTVAIIGLGGIGCMSAQLLARSGVGKLILVDKDKVELINLHRQILYDELDIGKPKVKAAVAKLSAINSTITIYGLNMTVTKDSMRRIKADLIMDCTDNLAARKAIAHHCAKKKRPWVFATALATKGMVKAVMPGEDWFDSTFKGKHGFHDVKSKGVLNAGCNAVACLQVSCAMKLLAGKKVSSSLILLDVWDNKVEKVLSNP
ncbi:MAG: HesA/MoeB/ThiF family protein [Nanoarchaeota archaeon]|nr:HesA/MoeB/ThiF family protein [Nanoarchaeota archaeon]